MGIIQLIEVSPTGDEKITAIDVSCLPATIGRGSTATYSISSQILPQAIWGLVSRIHATIYRRGDIIWLADGGEQPSSQGCYVNGRKMVEDQRLYEGVEVDLIPQSGPCRIYVAWARSRRPRQNDFPTLEVEREVLAMEAAENEIRIQDLRGTVDELGGQVYRIEQELARQVNINKIQDKQGRTTRVLLGGIGATVLIAGWILLGFDAEKLEELLGLFLLIIGMLGGGYATISSSKH